MRCFRCHGNKTYWSFTKHRRVECTTCKKTGEIYGGYPKNPRDHFDSDRQYNGSRVKPSIGQLFDSRS